MGACDSEGRGGGSLLTVQPLGIIFERALEFVFQALCRRIIQIRAKDHSIRLREFRICARVLCVCVRVKEIERQKKEESSVCVGCCEILLSLLKAIALCVRLASFLSLAVQLTLRT